MKRLFAVTLLLFIQLHLPTAVAAGLNFNDAIRSLEKNLAEHDAKHEPDDADTAKTLVLLAQIYNAVGQREKILPLNLRALQIREKVLGPNHIDTAESLNIIGTAYSNKGEHEKAIGLHLRALAIREKNLGAEHKDVATSLKNLAGAYHALEQYDKALPLYQRALVIREKTLGPEDYELSTILVSLSTLHDDMKHYDLALPLQERALVIQEKILKPNDSRIVSSLNNLASLHSGLGQYAKALPYMLRVLAIQEETLGADHPATMTTLGYLAGMYQNLGRHADALPLLERVQLYRENNFGPASPQALESVNAVGFAYANLGLYDKAVSVLTNNLAMAEKVHGPDYILTASSLHNLGVMYAEMGQYQHALSFIQRGLVIHRNVLGENHESTLTTMSVLADCHYNLSQYEQALALYQSVLGAREDKYGRESASLIASINNLAKVYETLGQSSQALTLYQRALAIDVAAQGEGGLITAQTLNGIAWVYNDLGQYENALISYQRALAIRERLLGFEHPDTIESLNDLANFLRVAGHYGQALALQSQTLKSTEKVYGPYHASTAISLSNLAEVLQHTSQPQSALPMFHRSLHIAQVAQIPAALMSAQSSMGEYFATHANPSAAIFHWKGAVNTMQSIRADSKGLNKSLQKTLLKKNERVYKQLAKLLVAQGRLAEAQQVLNMLKEDEYFDFIRRDAKADVRTTRMSYSGAERRYADKLEKLGKEGSLLVAKLNTLNNQAKLGLKKEDEKQLGIFKAQLAEQEKQTLALLQEIPKQLPAAQQKQLQQQRKEQAQLAASVQQQLGKLGKGVTLIQYLLLGDKVQILVTDSKQQIVREAPVGEAALYHQLVALRNVLEEPELDPRPASQALYQSLIAPIEADIKHSQTLMLSLDGALRYIPFSALYDGKHYLVERYQLALYTAAAKDKLTSANEANWKVSGLGVTQAHPGFSELPGVKDELAGIIGKQGLPGEAYLDQNFTAHQMQTSLKQGNPVLHLASHFQFTPGTEVDSYLLLGDGNHLSLKEIRQGDYAFGQLDLLTLSACATAMHGGQETNGKEVEGFGALAQNKGAKGVIATLWPIADESTAQLMQSLYRNRQQKHMNKAESLRQAQLALLNGSGLQSVAITDATDRGGKLITPKAQQTEQSPAFAEKADAPFAHPYFWAPFILMGNWL